MPARLVGRSSWRGLRCGRRGFGAVGKADGREGQFVAGGLLVDFAFAKAKVIRANGFQRCRAA